MSQPPSQLAALLKKTDPPPANAPKKSEPVKPRNEPDMPAVFKDMVQKSNTCLYLIRKLRTKMQKSYDVVTSVPRKATTSTKQTCLAKIGEVNKEVKETYQYLNAQMMKLPEKMPKTSNIEKMLVLYPTNNEENIEREEILGGFSDATYQYDVNLQYGYYLSEFNKLPHRSNQSHLRITPTKIRDLKFGKSEFDGHRQFLSALAGINKEITQKSLGIVVQTLHRTGASTFLEVKFTIGPKSRKEHENIYCFKFLLIEKSGIITFINIFSPSEDWKTLDDATPDKFIDPIALSRYKLFRQLTQQANYHLLLNFPNVTKWSPQNLTQFLVLFGKIRDAIGVKCRVCKKILRDFEPPTQFELRTPHLAKHEFCE